MAVFANKLSQMFGPVFLPTFVAVLIMGFLYAWVSFRSLLIPLLALLLSVGMLRFVWSIQAPGLPDFYMDRVSLIWLCIMFPSLYIYTKTSLRGPYLLDSLIFAHGLYILVRVLMTSPMYFHTWTISVFTPYAIYLFAKNIVVTRRQIRIVLIALVVLSVYYWVTSIAEKYKIPWLLFPRSMIEPHPIQAGRSTGPFRSPAHFGNAMAMIMPIYLYFIFHYRQSWKKFLLGAGFLMSFVGIFFTYTRGCMLAAVVGLAVAIGMQRKAYLPYVLPMLALVPVVAISFIGVQQDKFLEERLEATNPIEARIGAIVTGVRLWRDYPLFGCGPYQFKDYAPDYVAPVEAPFYGTVSVEYFKDSPGHDMYFAPTGEDGIVGQLLLFLSWFVVLRTSWQKYQLRKQGDHFATYILPLFFAIYAIYFLAGFLISFRHFAILPSMFWLAAGIAYGYDPEQADPDQQMANKG